MVGTGWVPGVSHSLTLHTTAAHTAAAAPAAALGVFHIKAVLWIMDFSPSGCRKPSLGCLGQVPNSTELYLCSVLAGEGSSWHPEINWFGMVEDTSTSCWITCEISNLRIYQRQQNICCPVAFAVPRSRQMGLKLVEKLMKCNKCHCRDAVRVLDLREHFLNGSVKHHLCHWRGGEL